MSFSDFIATTSDQGAFDPSQVNAGMVYPLASLSDAALELDGFSPVTLIDMHLPENTHKYLDQFEIRNLTKAQFSCSLAHNSKLEQENYCNHSATYQFLNGLAPESSSELLNKLADLMIDISDRIAASLSELEFPPGHFFVQAIRKGYADAEWHVDHNSVIGLDEYHGETFKFLLTLKGASTLYYTGSYHNTPNNVCLPHHNANLAKAIDTCATGESDSNNKIYNSTQPIFSAPFGFATLHTTTDQIGAIHSSPIATKPRLLLYISFITPTKDNAQPQGLMTPKNLANMD